MKACEWKEEYRVGNQRIDSQHKRWFEILDEADKKMLGEIESDIRSIGREALKSVIDYTLYHFSCEEQFMEEIGFFDLDRHKELHNEMIRKANKIASEMDQGITVLNSEVIKIIENWLVEHILNEDQKMKA